MTFIPGINFMVAGFLSGLISSGGDLKQGIIGAFSAGMFRGIGTHFDGFRNAAGKLSIGMRAAKVLAHGVAGGAMSALRGGKFREGFLSAGASQLAAVTGTYERFGVSDNPSGTAGYAKNAAVSAMLGGAVSKLSGGKFANGAITAAFSRMFNDLHNAEPKNVVATWLRGEHGGETFNFLPGSKISELLAQGDGARYFEDWIYSQYGDSPLERTFVTDFSYKFTWGRALLTNNAAEQMVGSWNNGNAYVGKDRIFFQIKNTMGVSSLGFGRQLSESGLSTMGSQPSDIHMTINWSKPRR